MSKIFKTFFNFHFNICNIYMGLFWDLLNIVLAQYLHEDCNAPLRMLRLSLPQNGSILGTSSPSAVEQGLWSGEDGMGGAWSCGVLALLGGGEVEERGRGGEEVVGVGV